MNPAEGKGARSTPRNRHDHERQEETKYDRSFAAGHQSLAANVEAEQSRHHEEGDEVERDRLVRGDDGASNSRRAQAKKYVEDVRPDDVADRDVGVSAVGRRAWLGEVALGVYGMNVLALNGTSKPTSFGACTVLAALLQSCAATPLLGSQRRGRRR